MEFSAFLPSSGRCSGNDRVEWIAEAGRNESSEVGDDTEYQFYALVTVILFSR